MKQRPEITYPCSWTYTLVGEGEEPLFAHAELVLAGLEHEKSLSHRSSTGRYTSIAITLVVRDEAQRLALFDALQPHPAVRVVI